VLSFKAQSLYAWGKRPGNHWMGGWATQLVQLLRRKEKLSCPVGNQIIIPPSYSLYTIQYTDCNIPASILLIKYFNKRFK
jgi:hypothetical protein